MDDHLFKQFDLSGKVALVTGGSRGLGRTIAGSLAAAGAAVVVVGRKQQACDAAAREITEATGARAIAKACHVARWDELDRLVDETYSELGRVDILVNNAGMSPIYESLVDVTKELWDAVLGVNLIGPFRLTALIGARMVAGGGGSIINISTVGSIQPEPAYLPYAAAKAGLNASTRAFAKELAPKVRVNCVMPGPFHTDITTSWTPRMIADMEASLPLGRIGDPEDIAGTMVWLASDAASYVTGQVFAVDGGMSA